MQTTSFPWDSVFAIVSFIVGLAVGFIQLWQAQRYFLHEQQTKFDQINNKVAEIAQRLAVIEGITDSLVEMDRSIRVIEAASARSQERMLDIIAKTTIGAQTRADAVDNLLSDLSEDLRRKGTTKRDGL